MRDKDNKSKMLNLVTDESIDTKIAIYARISLEGGESVEHQIALLKEVARTRNLGECRKEFVYEDVGVSATKYSIWTRPAMKQLLKDAKDGKFQIVMFKGISRFARSTQEALDVLDRLKAQGLRVISYEENYDSVKENSNFMFTMHAAIAEYEAEKTGIRVRLGNKAKTQSGKWCGCAPDGYRLVNGKLVIDEIRRHIIEKIFESYANGLGSFKVAEMLNKKGWLTSSGRLWCSKTVRDVIRNEAYIGTAIYNRTRQYRVRDYESSEEGRKKWIRDVNPEEEWVVLQEAHEPIISKSLFNKVQRILNSRRSKKQAPRAYHPLTGILFCGKCNTGMVCQKRSSGTTSYRYYICKTYHKFGRAYCKQANVSATFIEAEVIHRLENILNEMYPRLQIEFKLALNKIDNARNEKELKEIQKKIKKINRDTADLYFERHKMTEEQYDFIADQLKNSAIMLHKQQKEIRWEMEQRQKRDQTANKVLQHINEFFKLEKMDQHKQRQILHHFIERIEINGSNVEIYYRFKY